MEPKQPEPLDKRVERALGALRFFPNATLKITPFEAHHGREANTVLQNLTKKPSLRNLSCSNVLKSKSACLDEQDPEAQQMSKPADTYWGMRSDNEYGGTNHPLTLSTPQAVNQAVDSTAKLFQGPGDGAGPSRKVFHSTGDKI